MEASSAPDMDDGINTDSEHVDEDDEGATEDASAQFNIAMFAENAHLFSPDHCAFIMEQNMNFRGRLASAQIQRTAD
jgi:hypothetical protein